MAAIRWLGSCAGRWEEVMQWVVGGLDLAFNHWSYGQLSAASSVLNSTIATLSFMAPPTHGNIYKLQLVQNSLARLVTGTRKFDHIFPVLAELHWLPVSYRITYEIANLTHKTLSTSQPDYLSSSVHRRHLPDTVVITRSATLNYLTLPNIRNFRSDFSRRGYANCAQTIGNNLPNCQKTSRTTPSRVTPSSSNSKFTSTDLPTFTSHLAALRPRFLGHWTLVRYISRPESGRQACHQ